MRTLPTITLLLILILTFSRCTFISNYYKYRNTGKELINDVLNEDYNRAVNLFAFDHPSFKGTNKDSFKVKLIAFHNLLVGNFGKHLDYTMMRYEKKIWSNVPEEDTLPNTSVIFLQFSNDKEFGVFKIFFDDKTQKVIHLKTLDIKEPVPGMTGFWLFGLIAICIPAFNIYMIVRVKRSNLRKKWLNYIAIILLNVPSITYNAMTGLSFSMLSFQILLGVSFGYMGYLGSSWAFGIPIGSLLVLWQLYRKIEEPAIEGNIESPETNQESSSTENQEEILSDEN